MKKFLFSLLFGAILALTAPLTVEAQSIVQAPQGGTGFGSYTRCDQLVATSSIRFVKVPCGTNGQVWSIVDGFPAWVSTSTLGFSGGSVGGSTTTLNSSQVAFGAPNNTVTSSANFTFNSSTNQLSIPNVTSTSITTTNLTLSGFTNGSVIFATSSGRLTQDNTNLFWDDVNNRLGVGLSNPARPLQVNGEVNALTSAVRGTSVGFSGMDAANLAGYPRAYFYGYSGSSIVNFGLYAASGNATGTTQTPAYFGVSTNASDTQVDSIQFINYVDTTKAYLAAFKAGSGVRPVPIYFGHATQPDVTIATNTYVGFGNVTSPTARISLAAATFPAGGIAFGTDTYLYRVAADKLKTDDTFIATAIGVGTDGPSDPIHVSVSQNSNTSIRVSNGTSGSAAQADFRAYNSGGEFFSLGIYSAGTSAYGALTARSGFNYSSGTGGLVLMADNASGTIRFASGGNTERAIIDSTGRLGIGTSIPTAILSLNTSTAASGGIAFGSDTNLYRSAVDTLRTDDSFQIGAGLQFVSATGTSITSTNAFFTNATTTRFAVTGAISVPTQALPYAALTNGSALSVLGVAGNAGAANASITAGADGNVLRRSGTTVGFGAITLSSANAVTGILGVSNGGSGRNTATTAYGLIAAGTTATGVHQTIAPGTAGQFLISNGTAALGSFSNTSTGRLTISTSTVTGGFFQTGLGNCTSAGQGLQYNNTTGKFSCASFGSSVGSPFQIQQTNAAGTSTEWIYNHGAAGMGYNSTTLLTYLNMTPGGGAVNNTGIESFATAGASGSGADSVYIQLNAAATPIAALGAITYSFPNAADEYSEFFAQTELERNGSGSIYGFMGFFASSLSGVYSNTLTQNHVAFLTTDDTIIASTANGTTQTTTAVAGSASNSNSYRIQITSTTARFYLNEVLVATHTTNLPTGNIGNRQIITFQNDAASGRYPEIYVKRPRAIINVD